LAACVADEGRAVHGFRGPGSGDVFDHGLSWSFQVALCCDGTTDEACRPGFGSARHERLAGDGEEAEPARKP
jgi:hypothetical protein